MDTMNASGGTLTVGELREFIEGLPDGMGVYFFTKDDAWDSIGDVSLANLDELHDHVQSMESAVEDFDEGMEEYEEGIASGRFDAEKPEKPVANCVIFMGNHN